MSPKEDEELVTTVLVTVVLLFAFPSTSSPETTAPLLDAPDTSLTTLVVVVVIVVVSMVSPLVGTLAIAGRRPISAICFGHEKGVSSQLNHLMLYTLHLPIQIQYLRLEITQPAGVPSRE